MHSSENYMQVKMYVYVYMYEPSHWQIFIYSHDPPQPFNDSPQPFHI